MPLLAFDHVNIRTAHLEDMVRWYVEVLGLTSGARPAFSIPGAWLFLGDTCVIHLVHADPAPMAFREDENVRMEHTAFRAEGMEAFLARLKAHGVNFNIIPVEALETVAVFLRDPDGNNIHVDFPLAEYQSIEAPSA